MMIVCACSHLIKLDWQCIRYKADYITILYDSLSLCVLGQGVRGREVCSPAHEDDRDEDDTDTKDQYWSALIQRGINSKYLFTLRT